MEKKMEKKEVKKEEVKEKEKKEVLLDSAKDFKKRVKETLRKMPEEDKKLGNILRDFLNKSGEEADKEKLFQALREKINDENEEVRKAAVEVLGNLIRGKNLGGYIILEGRTTGVVSENVIQPIIEPLIKRLNDENEEVRKAAIEALKKMNIEPNKIEKFVNRMNENLKKTGKKQSG